MKGHAKVQYLEFIDLPLQDIPEYLNFFSAGRPVSVLLALSSQSLFQTLTNFF